MPSVRRGPLWPPVTSLDVVGNLQRIAIWISKVQGVGRAVIDWAAKGDPQSVEVFLRARESGRIGEPGHAMPSIVAFASGGPFAVKQSDLRASGADHDGLGRPSAHFLEAQDASVPLDGRVEIADEDLDVIDLGSDKRGFLEAAHLTRRTVRGSRCFRSRSG